MTARFADAFREREERRDAGVTNDEADDIDDDPDDDDGADDADDGADSCDDVGIDDARSGNNIEHADDEIDD